MRYLFGMNNQLRDGPFRGGGGYVFFLKKYSDSGGGKKNNLIQSFCHIT